MKASYDIFSNPFGPGGAGGTQISALNGAGWGFGWTAGLTFTPMEKTQIGVGYRSAINQKINGNLSVPAFIQGLAAATPGSVNLVLKGTSNYARSAHFLPSGAHR